MEMMAEGSSTTQMTVGSRRGSEHTGHRPPSANEKHSVQAVMRSTTAAMASLSARGRSGGAFSRWNASRCALRGPIPGRRASSVTSASTDGVRMDPTGWFGAWS